MDLGLQGRRAILVGASKGIGRATAEALVRDGCDVAICARDAGGVDEAVSALAERGGRVFGDAVDTSDAEAYAAWVETAASRLGGCDIFIPFMSAGGGLPSEEAWRNAFEVDLLAAWRGIEAALPHVRKSDHGSIVVISTTVALEYFGAPQPYGSMKAGLITYASALAQQLAPEGVRVNSISPGPVYIEGGAWPKVRAARPERYEQVLATIPMGRMGNAEEVARAIAFVASLACPFMTGTNIVIDGGLTRRVQY